MLLKLRQLLSEVIEELYLTVPPRLVTLARPAQPEHSEQEESAKL
jgi:hypothetical protein